MAKVNSAPSLDMVVVQDLTLGEGQGVENGDSLEVAYTGWLLQNHAIGQVRYRFVYCAIRDQCFAHCCMSSLPWDVVVQQWSCNIQLLFQVFDSNLNKDKLLRLKLGAGKVMKVSH